MFGRYDIPFKIVHDEISLSVDKEGENLLYRRESGGEKVEKILLGSKGKILLNPVEPVNKPKELTPYLLIELERTLAIEPGTTKRVFLKFPIEMGVFISGNGDFQVLDILTLIKPKFTLYGDPRSGFICKYWKSNSHLSTPPVDPIYEGVMELNVTNTNSSWMEVTKAVFNSYGMKIYYNNNLASLRANMKIKTDMISETEFVDSPLEEGMNKSLELYTVRKLSVASTKFVMELGI